MASKTTLNAKNLEALGAERLAELLIEISTGSAVAKRRLRLELAGAQSPKEAGREVAKRLTSIARARSFVNWQNRKPLVTDLESQLRAIREQIAPADPTEALALAWRFMPALKCWRRLTATTRRRLSAGPVSSVISRLTTCAPF